MKHVLARRLGVLTLGSALALGTLVAPAHADTTPSTTLANGWLSAERVGGLIPSQYGGSDYGLSIDAAFTALAAGDTATATSIRDALAPQINAYITGEAFGDAGSTYANAVAKALVLVQRTGGNPRAFGGIDLVARLESAVQASGGLRDTSIYGDNANTLGQAFAVEALRTAGSAKTGIARTFLLGQQCATGAFRLGFDSETDQTCAGAATQPTGSVDVTGLAVSTLANDTAGAAAVGRAVTWLTTVAQKADGSFATDAATPASNANSTGLAGAALGAVCAVPAANSAAAAIRALQVPATSAATADRGAIALNAADLATAQATGVPTTAADRDRYRRATAQAAPALTFDASAAPTVTVTGPTAVAPGSTQTITVGGASAGETVCLTTPGGGVTRLVGTGAPIAVTVTAPATGQATYTATTGPGSATFALTTAAATVPATPAAPAVETTVQSKKVSAGDTVKVKVSGLAPGTKVTTKLRGTTVDTTKAKANGVAKVRFTLKKRFAKPGKATLKIKPVGSKPVKASIKITR